MKITRFEDKELWQKARELTRLLYYIAKSQKCSKDFGLKDQICLVSVVSNTPEGFNSGSRVEVSRFLAYA